MLTELALMVYTCRWEVVKIYIVRIIYTVGIYLLETRLNYTGNEMNSNEQND